MLTTLNVFTCFFISFTFYNDVSKGGPTPVRKDSAGNAVHEPALILASEYWLTAVY